MRAAIARLPRAAWLCALVAFLSGTSWALIMPLFHVPDEVSHFAYAQYLAETGKLPKHNGDVNYSDEQQRALTAWDFYLVIGDERSRPPWYAVTADRLDSEPPPKRVSTGNAQTATNNPPLYYGLQAVPYHAGSALSLSDRVVLMRLASVLMAAMTALLTVLFLREVLPREPWAATVGGLAVALQPLFGSVTSGVQPDALLCAAAALLFYAAARVLRRGLTARSGALLGAAGAIGLMAKLSFVGLAPGVAVCLAVALWRARGTAAWRPALRGALTAAAVPLVVVLAYVVAASVVWDRPVYGAETTAAAPAAAAAATAGDAAAVPARSPRELVSYVWQLYLPRLPFMDDLSFRTPVSLWVDGFTGRFGWLDTVWPRSVYVAARWLFAALFLAAAVTAIRALRGGALRGRWGELATYGTIAGGLLAIIGAAGYEAFRGGDPGFEQARYLLPLLPLYAGVVALAARAAGSRWGPAVGAVLVVAALGHDVFAQLLAVARYYG